MRKLKIAQVAPFCYPQRGGVETVVKEYSERLVKRGHKVDVYTTNGNYKSPWVEDINGVKVHRSIRIPFPVLKPLSPSPLFPLKLLQANVDLIHIHANKYFSTDVGALVAKIKNTPLAYSPHAGTFGKSLFGRIYNWTIGRLALSADAVVCVSEYEKRLIEASRVKVKRFEILPNGVDASKYAKSLALNRKNEALVRSPMVLFVGRLSPHKGIDTLIDAAPSVLEKVPDVKFVIAGPDGGGGQSLKFKVQPRRRTSSLRGKSSKLENKFIFLGEVSDEEKIALLQKADVFVLPSRSEAFGITVIEAMAAGCPVVVSDIPALTEIVENGQTGFVFPVNDEKALASQIIKLLSDQNLSRQLSTNAKQLVKEKYDWEKIIDRLEDLYREVRR